jgi:uncharacterized membrane protein YphA (DoxX/SURF4 family)
MDFVMAEGFRTALHLVGRVLFGMLFIVKGLNYLTKLNDMSAYAASKGVPAAKPATVVTGLMIVAGGAFVLLGWHRFIGAGLLFIYLVPTAFMIHPFWKETDPAAKANEMSHFLKNLALAGAALLVAFYSSPSWPVSLGG